MLASRIAKSVFLSIVLAAAFSTPMIIHAIEEETRSSIYVPYEYMELLRTVVSLIYPLAALWLGLKASSRTRASISGFTLGMARASIETVVHPNYLFYSQGFLDSILVGALRFAAVNQLNIVDNFLLRNLSYILLGTFIASLGGLYGHLNRLSHPLKRSGNGIYVFRDYWSNRQRFDKNRFPENPSLDLSSEDKPLSSPAPELVLRPNGENVDVIETYRNQILASNLQNPHYLALRYEPQWNPIPLAIEAKISKLVMPLSVVLSLLAILLSASDLYSLLNQTIINISYISLSNVILLINVIGSLLFPTMLPVLVAFVLSLILIIKVNSVRKIKPESSLTTLFLALFMPILTFGTFSVSKAAAVGDLLIVRIWLFILLSALAILLFSSLRIRDFENISIYLYQNAWEDMSSLWYQQDKPVWVQGDFYWVIRYMYYWPMEMTFPLPHTDWERVEVWVNARTGQAEWILSDYHYRELWYEVVGPVSRVYVDFDPNFHTPLPINSNDELENIQKVLFYRLSVLDHIVAQAKYMLKGKWYNLWVGISFESQIRAMFRQMHSQELLQQITGSKIIASNLASLYWKNWRYPQGADRKDIYSATAKNLPATIVM
jgi:hypothetical protein